MPLRGEGSCGGGGAPRDSAGSGATWGEAQIVSRGRAGGVAWVFCPSLRCCCVQGVKFYEFLIIKHWEVWGRRQANTATVLWLEAASARDKILL